VPQLRVALFTLALTFCSVSMAMDATRFLPPDPPWRGDSERFVATPDDPWITPSERTGLTDTPDYDTTVAWLKRLADASPDLSMVSIGRSHEQRDIWMAIASRQHRFAPSAAGMTDRPLLLAHGGIHGGEIDGKDAGLMLLRDLTVSGKHSDLLDHADFLFIPILNVDGHERRSPYNRPNQRGPVSMGWRTNARNQNLNRDFTKLDTPEVRALLQVIENWQPDLYIALHVTDGADYQYDITFGGNGRGAWSPAINEWIEGIYRPAVGQALSSAGHVPGTLVFAANGQDMEDGFLTWSGAPRYSNGYGDARHLPTILVENHSLKSYRRRVLGTYVLLAASLDIIAGEQAALRAAISADRSRRVTDLPLEFRQSPPDPADRREFLGIRSERFTGPVSGGPVVRWTGETENRVRQEFFVDTPASVAKRPAAYLVPPAWGDIIDLLSLHGVRLERLDAPASYDVERLMLPSARIALPSETLPNPFEGRVRIDPGSVITRAGSETFPAGTAIVSTDQPLGDLAMLLLEPASPDSFLQWGFFTGILNRTEYVEPYFMEPLAAALLQQDVELRAAFEARLAQDPEFAASPGARLMWLYERTPYFDAEYRRYPVARLP